MIAPFRRVGVLGSGLMGSGIAQVTAAAGHSTVLYDVHSEAIDRARQSIRRSLTRIAEDPQRTHEAVDDVLARIESATVLDAVSECDLLIEAIPEDLDLKQELLRQLDAIVSTDAVIATNTSSLSVTAIATGSRHPERVLGLHFFSPVPRMSLVEVVRGLATDAAVAERAAAFVERIGKVPVAVGDTPGFVVNRLLVPYLLDAARAAERGVASVADIDAAMVRGAGHPVGPLLLMDLIGLDTALRVADILFHEFREPHYAAPPILRRLVEAGRLGRKAGRGFYDHSGSEPRPL